jgi:hypothetical protein
VSAMRASAFLLAIPVALGGLETTSARAEQERAPSSTPPGDESREHSSLLDHPHTVAELEGGILVLPSAPISQSNRGGATPFGNVGNGDATIETGAHLLYRASREWAFGAGAIFAPRPTSDPNYGGAGKLQRTHSRSYLFLGGEARYFPIRSRWFEAWFGLTAGGLIIADRFATEAGPAVPSILGTKEVTISTEGFSFGLQIGGDYLITDNWVVGLALRADRWLLPTQKPFSQETSCDAFGDCPTLTGSVGEFEVGVTVGYRIPL